jgi:hypothetical protein
MRQDAENGLKKIMPLEKPKNPIAAIKEQKLLGPGLGGMSLSCPSGGYSPVSFLSGASQR